MGRDNVRTLALYRNVECGSEDHSATTGAMALGLILYVIGFQSVIFWCSAMAPKFWMEAWFREAFKFSLSRWQPDVWYWGSCMVFRNFLMAIAAIVSSEPRVQLLYMVCFTIVYGNLTASYQPWVQPILVHFDVLTCVILAVTGIGGLVFLGLQQEESLKAKKQTVSRITELAEKVCGDASFITKIRDFATCGTVYELRRAENLFRKLNMGATEHGAGRSETTTFAVVKNGAPTSPAVVSA